MTRIGKKSLRSWGHPAGSGIRVREIINRYAGMDAGHSYRVTIPARLAGKRRFRQFTSLEAAETWAKAEHRGVIQDGQKHFSLSPSQRDDALGALAILDGTGLTLSKAAELAKKHHHSRTGRRSVREAIDLLLLAKESENLRARSVADLRVRLNIFCQTFGERSVSEIATTDVERWLDELRGISDRSAEKLSIKTRDRDAVAGGRESILT